MSVIERKKKKIYVMYIIKHQISKQRNPKQANTHKQTN